MFMSKARPEHVFTPRAASINEVMYVERPELETELTDALGSGLHLIIHGESGTGKSWLYKKVFKDLDVEAITANLANASRFGSIAKELQNLLDRGIDARKTGYTETKRAKVSAIVAEGELVHEGEYEVVQGDPFEGVLSLLRNRAAKHRACLVLDNLERVFEKPELMNELADLITLLDDPRYARFDVRMVIVGVPADVKRYFAKTATLATIANRLREVSEVARLSKMQAKELIIRGLVSELKYSVDDVETVVEHITWITDRIPQQIHEYCLELANIAERSEGVIRNDDLPVADRKWMASSLYSNYVVVEGLMNSRETVAGRRNQTIYAIGQCDTEEFRPSDIEDLVRASFPSSTAGVSLNIGQLVSELSKSEHPLLRRTPKEDAYRLVNPKYRMAIRGMMRKTAQETVEKVDVGSLV